VGSNRGVRVWRQVHDREKGGERTLRGRKWLTLFMWNPPIEADTARRGGHSL
jgi:hypothetical protein